MTPKQLKGLRRYQTMTGAARDRYCRALWAVDDSFAGVTIPAGAVFGFGCNQRRRCFELIADGVSPANCIKPLRRSAEQYCKEHIQ